MRNHRTFFLHVALALAMLTSCKHEPPPSPPEVCQYDSSVEEMKKWYYFKTGTWWVYEEQNTGALDTMTVYYHWAGTNSTGTVGFEWYCHSSWDEYNYNYEFNDSYSIHCLSSPECTCHKVERSKSRPGDYVGAGQIFLYPLIEGNYSYLISSNGNQGGQTTLVELSDSLILNGQNYYQVAHWQVFPDGSEDDQKSYYKVAKSRGIINRELPEQNQNWILTEFNIVQ